MTPAQVMRRLRGLGCIQLRQRGSHVRFVSPCGRCHTTVPTTEAGTCKPARRARSRGMEPCLEEGWLR